MSSIAMDPALEPSADLASELARCKTRIDELELEQDTLGHRYTGAMRRITQLEDENKVLKDHQSHSRTENQVPVANLPYRSPGRTGSAAHEEAPPNRLDTLPGVIAYSRHEVLLAKGTTPNGKQLTIMTSDVLIDYHGNLVMPPRPKIKKTDDQQASYITRPSDYPPPKTLQEQAVIRAYSTLEKEIHVRLGITIDNDPDLIVPKFRLKFPKEWEELVRLIESSCLRAYVHKSEDRFLCGDRFRSNVVLETCIRNLRKRSKLINPESGRRKRSAPTESGPSSKRPRIGSQPIGRDSQGNVREDDDENNFEPRTESDGTRNDHGGASGSIIQAPAAQGLPPTSSTSTTRSNAQTPRRPECRQERGSHAPGKSVDVVLRMKFIARIFVRSGV